MFCPYVTSTPVAFKDGKVVYEKRPHPLKGKNQVKCKKCGTCWCCMECATNCDALDHRYFDMIYDKECEPPYEIVCCKCSGNKPSWEERE